MKAFGYEITKLRAPTGKLAGVRIAKPDGAIRGHVAQVSHGVSFFVADESDLIQADHAAGRFYEEAELRIIGRHYKAGVFVDVGANVGNHAVYAAMVLHAREVIAFEPGEPAATILRINIALNDLGSVVTHHQVGLSSEPGRATLRQMQTHNLGSGKLETTGGGDLVIKRGDDCLADKAVAFIKIDTEGMELDVLRGLTATIDRCKPTLFVEVEDTHLADFHAFLDARGYSVADTFRRYPGLANYLAAPLTSAPARP